MQDRTLTQIGNLNDCLDQSRRRDSTPMRHSPYYGGTDGRNNLKHGYIAPYLRLFGSDVLVTDGEGTIIALNETRH